jgi:hypothetical protein
MQKPLLARGSIVVGLVIIVLSGLADALSLGRLPGFGWKQAAGVLSESPSWSGESIGDGG